MVPPDRRPIAQSAGLRLLNFAGASGLNRAERRTELVLEMRRQIAALATARVEQLIVFSGNRAGQDPAIGIANCSSALKEVAADAERAGIVLTFEVFNTFDHPDYDADNSDYAFTVGRNVSSPAVKVIYDIYHMHRMVEDVAVKVMANLEYVSHLHVAGSPRRDFPGESQLVNYGEVVRQIHRAGYRGAWGMEFLPAESGTAEELDRAATLFRGFSD